VTGDRQRRPSPEPPPSSADNMTIQTQTSLAPTGDGPGDLDGLVARFGLDAVLHSIRFRRVSNKYPHRVAEAYGGDIAAAAADDDATVAERVAEWEAAQGTVVRDWRRQGEFERDQGEDSEDES
jgi:hypothetical protein